MEIVAAASLSMPCSALTASELMESMMGAYIQKRQRRRRLLVLFSYYKLPEFTRRRSLNCSR